MLIRQRPRIFKTLMPREISYRYAGDIFLLLKIALLKQKK